MLRLFVTSARTAGMLFVLTGLCYPVCLTVLGQAFFPEQANGSVLTDDRGRVVGSALLAQRFTQAGYFQPRPSAAGKGYDGMLSGGSNLGPTSAPLRARALTELERLRSENPTAVDPVPAELVTRSASGLDPHLSPAGVLWQLPRVARARGVDSSRIEALVQAHIEDRTLGFLGEPRVNVLTLNLALDRQLGLPSLAPSSP